MNVNYYLKFLWHCLFHLPKRRVTVITVTAFFSDVYCGNLVKLLEVNLMIWLGPPYAWVPLYFLTLWVIPTEPPAVSQFQFRFFFIFTHSYSGFLLSLCSGNPWWPIFTCLSCLGDSSLQCVLCSLTDQRRIVDFSVCSTFTCIRMG